MVKLPTVEAAQAVDEDAIRFVVVVVVVVEVMGVAKEWARGRFVNALKATKAQQVIFWGRERCLEENRSSRFMLLQSAT